MFFFFEEILMQNLIIENKLRKNKCNIKICKNNNNNNGVIEMLEISNIIR